MTGGPLAARFTSPLHDERVAALLGAALGITFLICFLTGLVSYFWQEPNSWFPFPSRPAGLYRVTQGMHVTTGLMSIPLLLAKLWSVFPKLFTWPPFASVAQALERLALVPLIGGSLVLLFTGLGNINIYRPWPFGFRPGHYWAAWLTMGAMVVHVGAKWSITRRHLRRQGPDEPGWRAAPPDRLDEPGSRADQADRPDQDGAPARPGRLEPVSAGGLSRRGFMTTTVATATGVGLLTVGQTFEPLERLALLSPRRPSVGPQGLPVNRTAKSAGVTRAMGESPAFRLVVDGPGAERPASFSLEELRSMPQRSARLPIACVEGWSADARWTGVPVRELLALVGAPDDAEVTVVSFQQGPRLGSSELNRAHAHDRDTLLALELDGEPLHLDHGFPLRLIGPNRPGVLQTKWVGRLTIR